MAISQNNYRETYFQKPVPMNVSGDPTSTSLAKLDRECKAHAKSVQSELSGGTQGHLGLVSSTTTYELIAKIVLTLITTATSSNET